MSDMDMSRRGLLKTSLFGAAAAGMTGIAAAAEAKSSKKAPVYDAIVVGAGPAGLITAITAHDLGAKVVLFEKRDRPDGNAIYALGSVCGWGSRHRWVIRPLTAPIRTTSPKVSTGSKRKA